MTAADTDARAREIAADFSAPRDRVKRLAKDYLAGTMGRVVAVGEVVKRRGPPRMRIRVQWDDGSRTWLALDLEGKSWARVLAEGTVGK